MRARAFASSKSSAGERFPIPLANPSSMNCCTAAIFSDRFLIPPNQIAHIVADVRIAARPCLFLDPVLHGAWEGYIHRGHHGRLLEQRTFKWKQYRLPKPARSTWRAARVQAARQGKLLIQQTFSGSVILGHCPRLSVLPYIPVHLRRKASTVTKKPCRRAASFWMPFALASIGTMANFVISRNQLL